MSENINYKIVDTKTVTENITYAEAKKMKDKAKLAYRTSSPTSFLNYAQSIGSIVEGSKIVGSASLVFGAYLGTFQDYLHETYYFASEVKDLFVDDGYNLVKIEMEFNKIQGIDEGPSGNGDDVVCEFWIANGIGTVLAAHADGGWDVF